MADRRFPIQDGPSVPWEFMAPHESQARKNHGQTLEGLAKRGGLGCAEAWVIVHGLKHLDILHEEHKVKWIGLAERVNREWSVKQARAKVLAACTTLVKDEIYAESLVCHRASGMELLQGIRKSLLKLQPAAKDLEELLKEARRAARQDEIRQFLNKLPPLGAIRSVESLEDWIHKRMDYLTKRESELGKARVNEEKP